jgi:hypothetical protein
MNYIISLFLVSLIFTSSNSENQNQEERILQTVFDIEEFQNYLAYSPRFVGTNTKQEVLMMGFPEIENQNVNLNIRNKSIRVISEQEINELEHNFFIRIDEFDLKRSKAKVLLSYQNSRMYYEKKQKVLLDAQLEKTSDDEWIISNYKLYEVTINTSD